MKFIALLLSAVFALWAGNLTSEANINAYKGAKERIELPKDARCAECGMPIKNKQWATLIKAGGKDYYFDGVKDMAHFYFADEVAKEAYVSDYYTLEKLDAKEAFYVHGSNVFGPMGEEFIPFKDEAKANSFMKDHAGKGVIKFDEIKTFIGK